MPEGLAVGGAELGGRHGPNGMGRRRTPPRTLGGVEHRRAVALVAAVVGAASLGAEIAAARLLAPWFGASTIVWANTIATVLVALSGGYWVGGRLADRDPTFAGLCRLVLVAAALLAAVPFVAGPFLKVSVDALDSVEAGAFVGSLLAVLVLIAAPVVVLGCVAPYAVRLSVGELDEAGRVAGKLYAISTMGSLAGVFLSALVLIPFVGTRRTFLVFALALGLVALLGLRRRVAVLAPALVAVLIALPTGDREGHDRRPRDLGGGDRLPVRARRRARRRRAPAGAQRGPGGALGLHAGRWLTDNYWDEPLVLPFAARAAPPRSIAILGSAAGTVARAYGHFFPATRIDAVEIDPKLTEVGRELFDLRAPDLHTHAADARPWLRATQRRFDVIYVDAYRQPYIPFYLATKEFFRLAKQRLNPGGMVIVNVGHPEQSQRPGAGADGDDALGLRARRARPQRGRQHAGRRGRRRAERSQRGGRAGRRRAAAGSRCCGRGGGGAHRARPARRPRLHRRRRAGRVADRRLDRAGGGRGRAVGAVAGAP